MADGVINHSNSGIPVGIPLGVLGKSIEWRMSRLNTDNPDTMPVTDAVYGMRPKHRVAISREADKGPRGHTWPIWQRIPQALVDEMAYRWPARKKAR